MYADSDTVEKYLKTLEMHRDNIENSVAEIAIWSNGSISISEAKMMSANERERISKAILQKLKSDSGTSEEFFDI